MDSSEFGKWIKGIRAPHLSRAAMAKKYQRHANTLKAYENEGRLPDIDYLFALAAETKHDFQELLMERLKSAQKGSQLPTTLDVSGICESPARYFTGDGRYGEKHKEWKATGVTMTPTVQHGADVIYDSEAQTIQDGSLYVLEINQEECARRVQKQIDGGLVLICDNPQYPPQTLNGDQASELLVLGRICAVTNHY